MRAHFVKGRRTLVAAALGAAGPGPRTARQVSTAIVRAYKRERREVAEAIVLGSSGIDLPTFYSQGRNLMAAVRAARRPAAAA